MTWLMNVNDDSMVTPSTKRCLPPLQGGTADLPSSCEVEMGTEDGFFLAADGGPGLIESLSMVKV